MKKAITIYFFLVFLAMQAGAQEVVTGLFQNPLIIEENERRAEAGIRETLDGEEESQPMLLPFFDDFNQKEIFPQTSRWSDREVFINANFPYRSANIGAATLDALSSNGSLHVNASTFPFIADSLTSVFIRLDSVFSPTPRPITRADSVYLSFYYQPQGRGNPPEPWDSLVLEFGYNTGELVFANYYDSIEMPLSAYIGPNDTIYPGDTLYSPSGICDEGLYIISNQVYTYDDFIQVPCDSVFVPEYEWKRVWRSKGMSLEDFYDMYGTYCRQVLIPLTDSALYYRSDFRFRFLNYASLASEYNASWRGNCDQWNVDFIYLDIRRSAGDTTYRDVSFVERAPSMLRNYESMPYNQYLNDPTNELKNELEIYITNLDTATYNSTYYYTASEPNGPFEYLYPGGNCNLYPVYTNGLQNCITCAQHACPPVNFLFPLEENKDSAEYIIRHYIIGDITPADTIADTTSFRQRFFNYFAYDDGSPEEGYGLTPAGSKLAYRFKLNVRDTLRAVQMYFNRTYNNANEKYFDLVVWRDNNGQPGDPLYTQSNQKVEFTNSLEQFHTYMLDEPLPVNGIFYVGWVQYTSDNLNIGYDRYNNAQMNIFYNTSGEWYQSTFQGALLMRPLLGKEFQLSGIKEHGAADFPVTSVYPNPLNGNEMHFNFLPGSKDRDLSRYVVHISDMLGNTILTSELHPVISLPGIPAGIYLVTVSDDRMASRRSFKIIKTR